MPTQLLFFLFPALLIFACGCVVAWQVLDNRYRREVDELEREMTGKVRERYRAFLQLEKQVRSAIEQFDRCEADFARELEGHRKQVERLNRALDTYQGSTTVLPQPEEVEAVIEDLEAKGEAEAYVDTSLDWMSECEALADEVTAVETAEIVEAMGGTEVHVATSAAPSEPPLEQPIEQPAAELPPIEQPAPVASPEPVAAEQAPPKKAKKTKKAKKAKKTKAKKSGSKKRPAEAHPEIELFQTKIHKVQDQKKHEIERQSKVISQLTFRLENMEPLPDMLRRLEKELELWREKHHRLEEETAVEIARLRKETEDLPTLRQRVAAKKAALAELRQELERTSAAKDAEFDELTLRFEAARGEIAGLEQQVEELAPFRKQAEQLARAKDKQAETLREKREELKQAKRELKKSERGLEKAQGEAEKAQAEHAVQLETTRDELTGELERTRAELGSQLTASERARKAEVAGLTFRVGELEPLVTEAALLRKSQAELERSKRENEKEIQSLSARIEAQEGELRDWEERHESLSAERDEEVSGLRSRVGGLEHLEMQVDLLKEERVELEKKLTARKAALIDLTAERDELSTRFEEARAQAEDWKTRFTAAEERAVGLAGRLEEATPFVARAREAEAALDDWKTRYGELESTKEAEIAGLRTGIEGLSQNVERLEQMLVEKARDLVAQEAAAKGMRADLEQRAEEVENLQVEVNKAQTAMNEARGAFAEAEHGFQEERADRQAELERKTQELKYLQEVRQKLEKSLANQSETITSQEQRLNELEAEGAEANARVAELSHEIEDAQGSVAGQTSKIMQLMSALDDAKGTASKAREAVEQQSTLFDAAETVLAELRPRLEALEEHLSKRTKKGE